MVSFLDIKDDFDVDFNLTDSSGIVRRNQYSSNRRGSLAAEPADDDDIRAELSALTYQEFLMRHELLEAITLFNGTGGIPSEEARQELDEHHKMQPGHRSDSSIECEESENSTSSISAHLDSLPNEEDEGKAGEGEDDNGDDDDDDESDENIGNENNGADDDDRRARRRQRRGNQPWYRRLLDRKPTLEQEIKRKTEELKLHMSLIESGFEDVMDCQTETQQELIKKSIEESLQNRREETTRSMQRHSWKFAKKPIEPTEPIEVPEEEKTPEN